MQCVKCKNQQGRYYFAHVDKWDTCPCCDGKWRSCKTCAALKETPKRQPGEGKQKRQLKLLKKHTLMLEYQKRIYPFTPTVRELCTIFDLPSTSSVIYVLKKLEKDKLVISRKKGNVKSYYAVTLDRKEAIK